MVDKSQDQGASGAAAFVHLFYFSPFKNIFTKYQRVRQGSPPSRYPRLGRKKNAVIGTQNDHNLG